MKKRSLLPAILIFATVSFSAATYLDDIGYTQLATELGLATPTGAGVTVSQIEALDSGNYRPNPSGAFSGVSFSYPDSAGLSTGTSSHATTVADYFYGDSSMASGVSSSAVYEANRWLSAWLQSGTTSAPDASIGKVQNFSWIGSTGNALNDTFILARMDYAINRDGIIAVFGLNNVVGSVPNLMGSGFNGISVGRSDGVHSYGTTSASLVSTYGNARRKPDLVAPASATSWATPIVSSASVLLIQTATDMGDADGSRPEVVKSVLMAGATKAEFSDWSNTSTQPLDDKYGAGELNIRNSYHIMSAAQQNGSLAPSSSVSSTGWDWGSAAPATSMLYFFDLSETSSLSAVLTWNIQIVPNGDWSSLDLSLESLYLRLYHATAFALGAQVAESISDLDNVQLVWAESLASGRYALQVANVGSSTAEYGLAWQSNSLAPIPEPTTIWLLLAMGSLLLLARKQFSVPSELDRTSTPKMAAATRRG